MHPGDFLIVGLGLLDLSDFRVAEHKDFSVGKRFQHGLFKASHSGCAATSCHRRRCRKPN
jgi:hypothetical protein